MGTEGARALLERAGTLNLQTGNLLSWGCGRKKCPSTPSEEVSGRIWASLRDRWNGKVEKGCTLEREVMNIISDSKLFIVGSNSSSIRDAVDMACASLGVAQLDSVIIAPPPVEDGTSLSLEYLQPYWQELETLVENKKIVAIGTSDLDKTLLEQLYIWAQVRTNFLIVAFPRQNFVELLCEASFQEVLQESIQNVRAHEWIPLWILRYSVIVKSRGIIKSKGYIMQAKRNAS
uniref:GCS light chain n=1 Tax=Pavo cristatus TaxID=9049 RepID=A0A8C9EQ87_PAVCR